MSLLEVRGLVAGYGRVPVLHGLDFHVDEGELVTVIGANGAGKSTLLRTIAGINRAFAGEMILDGAPITKTPAARVNALGVAHVPENRRVFPEHPIAENLRLGAFVRRRDRRGIADDMERMYEKFPILGERRDQPAGTLSGGEQQMLAIAMALMARPRLLMLDEPSLGLAPIIVRRIFAEIRELQREGTTILLVEQIANLALQVADRGLVLSLGRFVKEAPASELLRDEAVRAAYLGT
ncbi:MAG: ABC transporter ATP-binding protein [Acidimicrobiia bacterium]|nr:ABC transporter ATP-binding protein [Acidimicrobiia bacterium]